MLDIVSLAP